MNFSLESIKYPEKFAHLCNQIVLAKYPSAKVIEGSGGDLGIDAFVGMISGEKVIFQFKYFTGRLSYSSRKTQIKKSLLRAARRGAPKGFGGKTERSRN